MADQYDGEWETIDDDKKKEVLGKLKGLEELRDYIDLIRESYTRLLKVNGVKDDGTWETKEPERLVHLEDIEEEQIELKINPNVKLIDENYRIIGDSDDEPISPAPNHASP